MRSKHLSSGIVYLSLIFIILYVVKNDYYRGFYIVNLTYFFISLFLMLIGYLFYIISWGLILRKYKVDPFILFESESLSIFNKYIPGKIWVVLGPISYLKKHYSVSTQEISQCSLFLQVVTLWSGMLLGLIYIAHINPYYYVSFGVLFLLMSVYLFSRSLQRILSAFIRRLFNRHVEVIILSLGEVLTLLILSILMWLFWSGGFYAFYLATTAEPTDIVILLALVFPIASVFGIIALFAPGGLGIREGIMVYLLLQIGMTTSDATQASVNSRIWFLIGESIIFLLALTSIYYRKFFRNGKSWKISS